MKFLNLFPYWLKGGLIGILICLISFLTVVNFMDASLSTTIGSFFFSVYFSLLVIFKIHYCFESICALLAIPTFVIYFFVGAVIGWVVGKIKSR